MDGEEKAAVLSALGAVKGPEGWTVECPGRGCEGYSGCIGGCNDTGRIPVTLAAQKEGGAG